MTKPPHDPLRDHHPVVVCSCTLTHLDAATDLLRRGDELKRQAHEQLHPSAPDPCKTVEILIEVAQLRRESEHEVRMALLGARNRCTRGMT